MFLLSYELTLKRGDEVTEMAGVGMRWGWGEALKGWGGSGRNVWVWGGDGDKKGCPRVTLYCVPHLITLVVCYYFPFTTAMDNNHVQLWAASDMH